MDAKILDRPIKHEAHNLLEGEKNELISTEIIFHSRHINVFYSSRSARGVQLFKREFKVLKFQEMCKIKSFTGCIKKCDAFYADQISPIYA